MIESGAARRVLTMTALGAALGAAALAAVFSATATIVLTFDTDPPRLVSGVFPAERDAATGLTFAWTGSNMGIRLPDLDRRREWNLSVRVRAARENPATNPTLSFHADGLQLSTHPTTAQFDTIHVLIPRRPQRPRGAVLRMDVSSTVVPGPADTRALGVMLDEVTIAPNGVVMPPLDALVGAALAVAALNGAMALLIPVSAGAAFALVVSIGQAAMLARGFGPYTAYPGAAARVGICVGLGTALVATLALRGGARLPAAARFVTAFSAGGLFLKLLVLLHPQMPVGDAMFHAHRFQGVLAGNLYFTSIAPGNYTFPYPPGFYLFAAAFSKAVARGAADMNLLRVVAVTVDVLAAAALYLAGARKWSAPWTGAAAVVLYHMLPLSFRIFTVGNLTNAFAQSVAVIAFVTMAVCDMNRRRSASIAGLTFVLAAAFMSHTSTFPILFCACVLVAIMFRFNHDDESRQASGALLIATCLAVGLAVALYYAHFGATYRAEFSRIRAETVQTAPDAGGRGIGARARSVPMYVHAYFGSGAIALAAAGAWAVYRRRRRDRLTLTAAGWAVACLMFLAVGVLTPVDMRYYLAALPALAVAGAAGAAALWSLRTAGRIAAIALLALVCWTGVITWYTTF